jgi:hypothetical protein
VSEVWTPTPACNVSTNWDKLTRRLIPILLLTKWLTNKLTNSVGVIYQFNLVYDIEANKQLWIPKLQTIKLEKEIKQNLISISISKSNTDLIRCIPRRRTTSRYNHQVRTTCSVLHLLKKQTKIHQFQFYSYKREKEVTKGFLFTWI